MKQIRFLSNAFRHMVVSCLLGFFLFSGLAQATNNHVMAQTVTANFNDVTLNDVIWELRKQTEFTFIYNTNDVQQIKVNDVDVVNEEVTSVLNKCMENSGMTYTVHNGVIAIKKNSEVPVASSGVQQQRQVIRGQVVDDLGAPLLGVNVVVKGSTLGAVTDIDGNFSLEVGEGVRPTLVVSYIGFSTQEVNVTPGQLVQIVMRDDDNLLQEVVVTGYGTFKKSAFAGSASTIKMSSLEDVPATDFKSLLQGSAPGVQVNSNSGALGGDTKVTIRGLGSFNASTQPLYVIDGVPVMTDIASSIDGGTDIMSTINVSDIENITVIKDAAAASLYGSRAANGVIIITTKSGKEGKPVFNLKADWGFSNYATKYRETMSGPERREVLHEGLVNQGLYMNGLSREDAVKYADENIDKYAPIPWSGWEDWESALFRTNAPYQNYEFSASGGDKKTSYFTSLSYTDQNGIIRQQHLSRITGRLNVKYNMTDKLQLGANILYSIVKQEGSSEGGTYTSPIYSSRHKVSASDPIYNEDGSYNMTLLANDYRNPKSQLDLNYKKQPLDRSFNTIYANYTFIPGLVFNTTFSLDHTNMEYKSWADPRSTDGMSDNGSLSQRFRQYDQYVWKNNLTYVKDFGGGHHLDVLGGFETNEYRYKTLYAYKKNFPTVDKHEITNGAQADSMEGMSEAWRLVSYLGRVNYDFNHKYYLGGCVRIDGSSRLHKDSRWGTFWSVSGAWRLSSEDFMKEIEDILSDARFRVSFGSNGTLPQGSSTGRYFQYMDLVSFKYSYNGDPAIRETHIGNKDLNWEKNYNLNVGVDFRLFDRVSTTVEFYSRRTSDLLMDMPLSQTTGFSTILSNVGRVQNKGIEIDINADVLRIKDFSWNSSLNLGHNRNKVLSLSDQDEIIISPHVHQVGSPYYQYYVKEFAGINPDTGYPVYFVNGENGIDENGNRRTTEDQEEAEYIAYKGPDPKLSGGWNNTFRYKMFDLSFSWTFTLGGYSYDNGASKLEHGGKETAHNLQTLYRDRWQKPGDNTNIEMVMVGNPYDMSSVRNSRRVHSTDHLRLKNITFGVSLPKHIVRKASLENVRFYFSGVNLLTFAAYDGYDPEIPLDGIIYFEAPKMKTVTFGVDIKF